MDAPSPRTSPASPGSDAWLSNNSAPQPHQRRRLGSSLVGSLFVHIAVLTIVMIAMSIAPTKTKTTTEPQAELIYVPSPSAGGGGGGGAPQVRTVRVTQPRVEIVQRVQPTPLEPPPTLSNLLTPTAVLFAAGDSGSAGHLGLAPGGNGTGGTGTGPGAGSGGPGSGGAGTGDFYGVGSGVSAPIPLYSPNPRYTSDAMRAKIQGVVQISGIVETNGTFTNPRVIGSLDKTFGLDAEAIRTALTWTFKPGMKDGKSVRVMVTLEMTFTLR